VRKQKIALTFLGSGLVTSVTNASSLKISISAKNERNSRTLLIPVVYYSPWNAALSIGFGGSI